MHEQDQVAIADDGDVSRLSLPYASWSADWKSTGLPPFEVIDGQHRLFAFDDSSSLDFEVPVVAFYGLDISWQAYLFYTINIKPKRINPSLAFDLYPLLRSEDWLERAEGHSVYRETRAQEITESLWAHPQSPWYDRINMLGERGVEGVSQSSWIKSIMATLIKPWTQRGSNTGGLFGSRLENEEEVLGWNRAQQAAFLIFSWRELERAVIALKTGWAQNLRAIRHTTEEKPKTDPAFGGQYSLIASDQGVRGFLQTLNDVAYFNAAKWKLGDWHAELSSAAADNDAVTQALATFEKTDAANHVREFAADIAAFDWRTSSTPDLDEQDRRRKLVFRGSGGYKELRLQLLEHLEKNSKSFSELATKIKNQVFDQ
ncbi:DGQHR domain protein [Sphingopyxis sp. LC81]|nr:DGQHR domain protein [Sphingopyxis sp. LC81]